jgi:hypothetical protein
MGVRGDVLAGGRFWGQGHKGPCDRQGPRNGPGYLAPSLDTLCPGLREDSV